MIHGTCTKCRFLGQVTCRAVSAGVGRRDREGRKQPLPGGSGRSTVSRAPGPCLAPTYPDPRLHGSGPVWGRMSHPGVHGGAEISLLVPSIVHTELARRRRALIHTHTGGPSRTATPRPDVCSSGPDPPCTRARLPGRGNSWQETGPGRQRCLIRHVHENMPF